MQPSQGVVAVFSEPSQAASAIRTLHAKGYYRVRATMPAPFPEVMDALQPPTSAVGVGVLLGTILGLGAGLGLCILTSLAWPLVTGGKPIVSLPAFAVIAFECAVLIGGSVTHAVLAYTTLTGRLRRGVPDDDPRFMIDRIGVFAPGDGNALEPLLREAGAEEVRRVA
jgi:hypothetical protein